MSIDLNNLVFVGLNNRVAALDCRTGEMLWKWRATKPSRGYVSLLLLNQEQLIVSVNGYTYCLDPRNGEQRWFNELSGFGIGVTSIASPQQSTAHAHLLAAAAQNATQEAAHSN